MPQQFNKLRLSDRQTSFNYVASKIYELLMPWVSAWWFEEQELDGNGRSGQWARRRWISHRLNNVFVRVSGCLNLLIETMTTLKNSHRCFYHHMHIYTESLLRSTAALKISRQNRWYWCFFLVFFSIFFAFLYITCH